MTIHSLRRLCQTLMLVVPLTAAAQGGVPLQVRVVLVDAQGAPVADAPLRVVVATGTGWQRPEAGEILRTDGQGQVLWATQAQPEQRRRKLPTNFFTQLSSAPLDTTRLAVGVELAYLGRPWLVVASGDRFPDGNTAQLDGLQVLGRDAAGQFSLPAVREGDGWQLPGVAGRLTTPGFQVEQFSITPAGNSWAVDLSLRRLAEPVVR